MACRSQRLALHLGGVPFEDYRPSRDEWRALRDSGRLPFNQLPVLEVDGTLIGQTGAIARFCGKLAGLYPTNDDLAAAKIDQVIDAATDVTIRISPTMRVKDLDEKLAMRAALAENEIPKWLGFIQKLLLQGSSQLYFVGDELTVADLAIWRLSEWLSGGILEGILTTVLDGFPALKAHAANVGSEPRVRAWMQQHYG